MIFPVSAIASIGARTVTPESDATFWILSEEFFRMLAKIFIPSTSSIDFEIS